MVEKSEYLAGVPMDVQVNLAMRRYEIRWNELKDFKFYGKEVFRTVPFVPRMRIVVSATYNPQKEGGSYGYRITNGKESEKDIIGFGVECQGLTAQRSAQAQAWGGGLVTVKEGTKINWMFLPAAYLQDFRFFSIGPDQMALRANPGESLEYPPMLSVPWRHLPGLVACWVEPADYNTGLDVEMESQNLLSTFSTNQTIETPGLGLGKKSEPRYAYRGRTIGPVPAPEAELSRVKFLGTITEYLNEAEALGWTASKITTGEIRRRLSSLAGAQYDTAQIGRIIDYLEQAERKGEVLAEAFILLKYNLSYLADQSNWKDTP